MTNEEIFTVFLKKYRKNKSFKDQRVDFVQACDVHSAIDTGLTWINTTEGSDYWIGMYEKWVKLCVDFKLTGSIDLTKV